MVCWLGLDVKFLDDCLGFDRMFDSMLLFNFYYHARHNSATMDWCVYLFQMFHPCLYLWPWINLKSTSNLFLALTYLVNCIGWLPLTYSLSIYSPRYLRKVFFLLFMSSTLKVSLINVLPLSIDISFAVGSWYLGWSGSTTLFVLN